LAYWTVGQLIHLLNFKEENAMTSPQRSLHCITLTIILILNVSSALARDDNRQVKPPELADLAAGTYYGDVISDSQGSSQSDVTVTVTKLSKWVVRVTSDYPRLGTTEVNLTKIGNQIMQKNGDTVFLLDLGKQPPKLDYNPHNEVAYSGERR
jgi:hypothetical protein